MENIKEQLELEEVIKKYKEKLKDDFDKWFFSTEARFNKRDEMNDIADWWLSQIYPSLIADEVLNVVVEEIKEKFNMEFKSNQYYLGSPDMTPEEVLQLLSNLSPNKENKNNV